MLKKFGIHASDIIVKNTVGGNGLAIQKFSSLGANMALQELQW